MQCMCAEAAAATLVSPWQCDKMIEKEGQQARACCPCAGSRPAGKADDHPLRGAIPNPAVCQGLPGRWRQTCVQSCGQPSQHSSLAGLACNQAIQGCLRWSQQPHATPPKPWRSEWQWASLAEGRGTKAVGPGARRSERLWALVTRDLLLGHQLLA